MCLLDKWRSMSLHLRSLNHTALDQPDSHDMSWKTEQWNIEEWVPAWIHQHKLHNTVVTQLSCATYLLDSSSSNFRWVKHPSLHGTLMTSSFLPKLQVRGPVIRVVVISLFLWEDYQWLWLVKETKSKTCILERVICRLKLWLFIYKSG